MLIRLLTLIMVLVVFGCSGRGRQAEQKAEASQKLKSTDLASKINSLKPCFQPLADKPLPNINMTFERKESWKVQSSLTELESVATCLSQHLDSKVKTFSHEGVPVIHLQNHSISDEIRAQSGPALRLQSLRVQMKKTSK